MMIPGVERWPADAKREFARIIRLKGSRRDSDFQRRFDRHLRLRRSILELTRDP